MRRVSLEVTYPAERAHPVHRELMGTDGVSRGDLLTWSPAGRVRTLLWYDGDRETVRGLLGELESLRSATLVGGDGGTYVFSEQGEYELADEVMALVSRARVAFLPPVTFLDSGAVRFDAVGEADRLGAFYDALGDLLPTRVRRVAAFDRPRPTATLTDRQRAALDAAVEAGYYAVPRTGSVADVAAELDCATSTAGELLRRAESAVLTGFVDDG
jgi:molybdopterin converting factor small subunit